MFIVTFLFLPLIDFQDHRFNLTIQNISQNTDDANESLMDTMIHIKNILPSATLQKLTSLKPVLMTITRRSSTYQTLKRYQRIQEFLPRL